MERFVVRKNTLPYVHQYVVVDTKTGCKMHDHKTWKLAVNACKDCNYWLDHQHLSLGKTLDGLENVSDTTPGLAEDAYSAASKRMKHPDSYPPPKSKPKYSNKRRVELD